ncbi:MAG: SRPBCC family protein [Ornithinimicrobium sp.]
MSSATVTPVDAGPLAVARQVFVAAPASAIFALVADPRRHGELDGSGTVRDTVSAPERLEVGSQFSVAMKQYGLPYSITSTVTAYDPDRRIEWRHPLGHRWRWELTPQEGGSTLVTETFDYSRARSPQGLELFRFPSKNGAGITATLEALAARFA